MRLWLSVAYGRRELPLLPILGIRERAKNTHLHLLRNHIMSDLNAPVRTHEQAVRILLDRNHTPYERATTATMFLMLRLAADLGEPVPDAAELAQVLTARPVYAWAS